MSSWPSFKTQPYRPPVKTWIVPWRAQSDRTRVASVAGRVYMIAVDVSHKVLIDQIHSALGAAVGGNAIVGIYRSSVGTPEAQPLVYGSPSIATAGSVVNHAVNLILQPGQYFIATQVDGNVANCMQHPPQVGFPMFAPSDTTLGCYYDRAGGYGLLTDPCPAVTYHLADCHTYQALHVAWWFPE